VLPPGGFDLTLIPVAVAAGCAAHIWGDMLTQSGCPLLLPVSRFRFRWWPRPLAFITGTAPSEPGRVHVKVECSRSTVKNSLAVLVLPDDFIPASTANQTARGGA
jgi:hypothetical protein